MAGAKLARRARERRPSDVLAVADLTRNAPTDDDDDDGGAMPTCGAGGAADALFGATCGAVGAPDAAAPDDVVVIRPGEGTPFDASDDSEDGGGVVHIGDTFLE